MLVEVRIAIPRNTEKSKAPQKRNRPKKVGPSLGPKKIGSGWAGPKKWERSSLVLQNLNVSVTLPQAPRGKRKPAASRRSRRPRPRRQRVPGAPVRPAAFRLSPEGAQVERGGGEGHEAFLLLYSSPPAHSWRTSSSQEAEDATVVVSVSIYKHIQEWPY